MSGPTEEALQRHNQLQAVLHVDHQEAMSDAESSFSGTYWLQKTCSHRDIVLGRGSGAAFS